MKKYTNEELQNIKKHAKNLYKLGGGMIGTTVTFNEAWYKTIIRLCEQAKTKANENNTKS